MVIDDDYFVIIWCFNLSYLSEEEYDRICFNVLNCSEGYKNINYN